MTSICYIENLSRDDIILLTQLLANTLPNRDPTQWLHDQSSKITTLPPQLLRPTSLIPRLALHLPFRPYKIVLCPSHKQLNPQLIHRIFLQISAESTIRLTRLLSSPELEIHPVPPIVSQFVQRIQAVNSLWIAPETYTAVFHTNPRFKRVESGCEACILAHVGGNRQLLMDLRTAMLGRRRKHQKEKPVLWAIVEGWIGWTGEGEEIRSESDRIGKEVRVCRRILQLTRRGTPLPEKYQNQKKKNEAESEKAEEVEVVEVGEGEGDAEDDFENSIIEYYRNLLSTTSLPIYSPSRRSSNATLTPTKLTPQESLSTIHPAFRDSLIFCPATGTFEPARPAHPVPRPAPPTPCQGNERHRLYNLNNETVDSGFFSEAISNHADLTRTAEERAESYKRLVARSWTHIPPTSIGVSST